MNLSIVLLAVVIVGVSCAPQSKDAFEGLPCSPLKSDFMECQEKLLKKGKLFHSCCN